MSTFKSNRLSVSHKGFKPQLSWLSVAITTILMAGGTANSVAQENSTPARKARVIEANEIGVQSLGSLAYSSEIDTFFVGQAQSTNDIEINYSVQKVSAFGDNVGTLSVSTSISNPINVVFDETQDQLLFLNSEFSDKLIAVNTENGNTTQFDFKSLGLNNPQGLALDSTTGILYILDADDQQILVVKPGADQDFSNSSVTRIDLNVNGLRGIALNPTNGHLYVLNPDAHELYQLTQQGDQVMTHDLSGFILSDSQGIIFAPSGDQTDNPAEMSLYIANTGLAKQAIPSNLDGLVDAGMVEFSLSSVFQSNSADIFTSSAPTSVAALINTIDTSSLASPSHDPSGITYLETPNTLLICDGEIEEPPFSATNNLFELSVGGDFVGVSSILSFTKEPTGVSTLHPTTQHIFFTDDDANRIFELGAGADKQFGTADDSTASFIKTMDLFTPPGGDPEGVALAPGLGATGALFVVDGDNREIYRLDLINNGLAGSTMTAHFDTDSLGIPDPEGIEYHTPTGHLLVLGMQTTAGTTSKKAVLFEMTTEGEVLQEIDISAAPIKKAAGLALAPSSIDANQTNLYIADRGKDPGINGDDIQDGEIFEVSFTPTAATNTAPYINAGEDKIIVFPATASLSGAVNDDGLPASTTVTWAKVSGSGSVTFTNDNSVTTTASFSEEGTYVLKLTADDTDLSSVDEVTVEVSAVGTTETLEVRIAASSDDAEENSDGEMVTDGNDLDISDQLVGLRFSSISIPPGSIIKKAYVQFTAHNTSVNTLVAMIEGHDADDAPTFIVGDNNNTLSNRIKTTAQVDWNRTKDASGAWTVGEAGTEEQTPDLTEIIQEIVGRSGWTNNNSLALIISHAGAGSKREAKSYDTDFDHATAPLLHIEFIAGANGNQLPIVDAGQDQSVDITTVATLSGTVSDDGNLSPLTTLWVKRSGPDDGIVNFNDASAVDTTVSFSKAGTYVLELTADDGEFNVVDEVYITVEVAVKVDQEIIGFASTAGDSVLVGENASLSFTSSGGSGELVFYQSQSLDVCTIAQSTVNFIGAGICQLTADQDGNEEYNAAPQVTLASDIRVNKGDQKLSGFQSTPTQTTVGSKTKLSVSVKGASSRPVIFNSITPEICTVNGTIVTFIAIGSCKLTADQGGDDNYNAAEQVSKIINIGNGDVLLGDSTGDSQVNILDVIETINRVLAGKVPVNGADCNEDGDLNITDIVCTINLVLNVQ